MQEPAPAIGTAVFFVLAPGVVAGAVPWLLTGWVAEPAPPVLRFLGAALVASGVGFLLHAFARFVTEGRGTPAPVAPTEELVVGGVYRWVRNPMYLAVAAIIGGQALLLARAVLGAYLVLFLVAVVAFVRLYEEPTLRLRHGESYEAYRRAVPAWWPRRPPG